MSAIAIALCCGWVSQAAAQTAAPSQAPTAPPAQEETRTNRDETPPAAPATVESIEVTGSRLKNGDVTAKVTVITAEEIEARGVTSVEELIRTLPQNVATIGAITNERARGPLTNRNAPVSQLGSFGVAAANLGGLGAGNTLILVNGRRIAGAAGIEDGFANLNGIPLSAVERVEITEGGSSAVYGSDAVGGVINFILKSNFTGTTVTVQHEYSSNDADNSRISLFSGYAWGSGSLSGTLGYSERSPINNYKTGYTTQNYSSYFNGDPAYDFRSFRRGLQPGVIDISDSVQRGLTVRPGLTGRPTIGDFYEVGRESLRDYVPELAGPDSKTISATLNFQQKITDKLSIFVDGLYSRADNEQERYYNQGLGLPLAPGQYYNPFPIYYFNSFTPSTNVNYNPAAELEAGLLPSGKLSGTSSNWSVNAGATYQFNADTKLEVVYTTSKSDSSGTSQNLSSLVSFLADRTSPNGVRCYNFNIENNRFDTTVNPEAFKAAFQAQCLALTSTDPNVAFNPFNSTATGGGDLSVFLYDDSTEQRGSRLQNWEARLTGALYTLPAGKIYYAVGGEYNDDGVDSREVKVVTGQANDTTRYAYFGELSLPIFGGAFNYPMARTLTLNLAARNDTYKTEGVIGTVNGVPVDQGGQFIFGANEFSRTTPSIGVLWEPFKGLSFRGKWTEGFKAPPFTQLFSVNGTINSFATIINDPYYTCAVGECSYISGNNRWYRVPLVTAPNPDLKPQTSSQEMYSVNWRPSGALQGLYLSATYNHTKIDNEYARTRDLQTYLPQATILSLEQFYPRDANGKIISQRNLVYNISGSEYASVTYEGGYLFQTRYGTFEPKVTYLDNLKSETKVFDEAPAFSTLGRILGADDYKVVGSVGWYFHDLNATMWAYYTPSYINDYAVFTAAGTATNAAVAKKVDDYLTIDLTGSWRVSNDVRLAVAGRNILDAKPPLAVISERPYDTARYNAEGRTLSLELQYSF